MEKKKTAVEWFNQQLVDRQNGNGDSRSRDEIFAQAKQMEKGQIVKAHTDSLGGGTNPRWKELFQKQAEQYYESKYGKDENKSD